MKKIFSITCLAILMLSANAYSQSNLTWKVKDNIQKGFFKSHTTFNTSFTGFTSKDEATKFFTKMRSNPEVVSAEVSNADANGNCDLKLVMKEAHDKMYYVGLAQKLGVAYFEVNGKKQTPDQIVAEKRNKK
jgi:hypothetical protein